MMTTPSEYEKTLSNDHVLLLMEAAQVLWEAVEDNSRFEPLRERYGSPQLRNDCRELSPRLLEVYDEFREVITNGLGLTYDWEFTPLFIRHCVDDSLCFRTDAKLQMAKALLAEAELLKESYQKKTPVFTTGRITDGKLRIATVDGGQIRIELV